MFKKNVLDKYNGQHLSSIGREVEEGLHIRKVIKIVDTYVTISIQTFVSWAWLYKMKQIYFIDINKEFE